MMPGGPMSRTETKGLSERERQRQNNTSNSSYLAHKFFPWACTKPFVIFTDALFKVDAYF